MATWRLCSAAGRITFTWSCRRDDGEERIMAIRRDVPEKGPERLGEVLSRLFTARGWGRRQDRLRLERAWAEAVGEELAAHTRPEALRRGVLEVVVDSAVLLQELTHFHKRRLLAELRQRMPGTPLTDLRFRAGVVK
jgi:predicted nucleic acid-binding Zn ribbon protein